MALQARLKPYDPKSGHVLQGVTFAALGKSYEHGVVYNITPHEAEVLRKHRQRHGDPNSLLAFDVLDEREMKRLLAGEARKKLGLTDEAVEAIRDELDQESARPQPQPQRQKRPGR